MAKRKFGEPKPNYSFGFVCIDENKSGSIEWMEVYGKSEAEAMEVAVDLMKEKFSKAERIEYTGQFKKLN